MSEDYSKLEGRVIDYIYNDKGSSVKGEIVGCNYDVGMTVVSVDDKSRYLLCLNGPLSPVRSDPKSRISKNMERYRLLFNSATAQAKGGTINPELFHADLSKIGEPDDGSAKILSSTSCPFGQ